MNISTLEHRSVGHLSTSRSDFDSAGIVRLNVRDATTLPGPGTITEETDDTMSGERYLNEYLLPKYNSLERDQKLLIDMDGTSGYGVSFIREVFKGLVLRTGDMNVKRKLLISLTRNPYRKEQAWEFIDKGLEELKVANV